MKIKVRRMKSASVMPPGLEASFFILAIAAHSNGMLAAPLAHAV
jgi:hypothetical protein